MTATPTATPGQRSIALDVMRGLTVALMITVNMSIGEGKSYGPLLHAAWHGLTLTDLVFPTFMFVVGAAMSFSLDQVAARGDGAFLRKVATRTALIFLCGYLLYWFPFLEFNTAGDLALRPIAHTRIPGVLQRIALGYGFAALILHYGKTRGALIFSAAALLGYWALMAAFGDYTLQGNAALKLDIALLGEGHLYGGEGMPFDPEGILSTLPAIVNTIAGYLAARFLRQTGIGYEALAKLLMAGVVLVIVALAWHSVFPINKKLWTSSYVLVTIGIDLCLLALLSYLIDMTGPRRWTYFFEVFGRNTLFIYLFSELLMTVMGLTHVDKRNVFDWLYEVVFAPLAGDKLGSLIYSVGFMLMCWLLAWGLDRRKIYIRL